MHTLTLDDLIRLNNQLQDRLKNQQRLYHANPDEYANDEVIQRVFMVTILSHQKNQSDRDVLLAANAHCYLMALQILKEVEVLKAQNETLKAAFVATPEIATH